MNSKARLQIYLPVAAIVFLGALAVPAAAQKPVPFKGTMQATDTDSAFPTPTTVVVLGDGSGIGTLLGQFKLTYELTVDLVTSTSTGTAHFIAANGDSIYTTLTGSAEPTSTPNVISITEIYTITAGTGRFAGAQGSFVMERLANTATFFTSGSFHGTISSPGASH